MHTSRKRWQGSGKQVFWGVVWLILAHTGQGCSSKKVAPEVEEASVPVAPLNPQEGGLPSAFQADQSPLGDSDSGKAAGLQTLHFAFDSFELDATARQQLKNNVKVLKAQASLHVQIEGHCDHRGSREYNIALGEKRAQAVLHELVKAGVGSERLTTISFGKEKPLEDADTETAAYKNRRANFSLVSR